MSIMQWSPFMENGWIWMLAKGSSWKCDILSSTQVKMCARAYLKVDRLGKGSHLSFLFVIMREGHVMHCYPGRSVRKSLWCSSTKLERSNDWQLCPDPTQACSNVQAGKRWTLQGCPMFIRIEHLPNEGFIKDAWVYSGGYVRPSQMYKCNKMFEHSGKVYKTSD